MKTTTTHTPPPWYQLSGHVISRTVTADHASDSNLVVPGGVLSAANAAHIVHCVNTHAALVAALEGASAFLETLNCRYYHEVSALLADIDHALGKE